MTKTLMNSSYQILHHMGIIMEMDMVIVMETKMEIMGMTQIMNLNLVKVLGYMHMDIPIARKRLFQVWSNKTSSSLRTTRKMLRTLSFSSNSTL